MDTFNESNKPILELTDEQKKMIREFYDKEDINSLTKKIFNNNHLDGRSKEGKAIKMYLASFNQIVPTTKKIPKQEIILTEEQRKFIEDNIRDSKMKPLEMTKVLFPDSNVTTLLSNEGRAVYKYCKVIDEHGDEVDFWDEPVENKQYKPPATIQGVLGLVNEYVSNPKDPSKNYYNLSTIKPFEEKCLRALQGFLKTPRFRYQAAQYDKKADRTLFESSFVRTTHDKPDLGASDVDLYIAGAAEVVNMTREERKILRLEDKLNVILDGDDSESGEKQHLSQAFVELINQTRTKWDISKKRVMDIYASLESTRAKRNDHLLQKNQSVLNLLEAWQKDEETRNDILALGEKEKNEDVSEVKRLRDMDSVVALIAGMTNKEGSS